MDNALNQLAVTNPQPGDYWHEMFCPYFLVVAVDGDDITVLDFISKDPAKNARVNDSFGGYWEIDYSRARIVNRDWIKHVVSYNTIPGFVADVVRNDVWRARADEWRIHECDRLKAQWEKLSGWTALKEA